MSKTVKDLKIKTKSVSRWRKAACHHRMAPPDTNTTRAQRRIFKDMEYTEKEIASQQARIQKVKDDPEKDEHDVKKQEEVLAEYLGARTDEFERLKDFTGKLKEFMVHARPWPWPWPRPREPARSDRTDARCRGATRAGGHHR